MNIYVISPKYIKQCHTYIDTYIDKLETTPLRVVVSYAYLVFSQPPKCLHQAM